MGTRRKKKVPQHIAPDKGLSGEVSKSLRTCEYPWPGSLGRKNPLDFSPILASFFFYQLKLIKLGLPAFYPLVDLFFVLFLIKTEHDKST